jgi:hypothetical protein
MAEKDEILEKLKNWEKSSTGLEATRFTDYMKGKYGLGSEEAVQSTPRRTSWRTPKVSRQGNYNAGEAMPTGDKD